MTQTPILSVSNLVASFQTEEGWKPVVKGVSFDVRPGETVALVGESGSGKSVTSLSVMGLTPSRASRVTGSIKLNGRELVGLSEAEWKKIRGNEIAMIFQEPMSSLNPVLTVGYQIAESLVIHRGLSRMEAEAETVRLLEKVRIPSARSRLSSYPHNFSGGMRQRVMIAMALACKPTLLIADEPTTALDVTIQAEILELIKQIQEEEQMSVLFITHDMGVVAEIADRTFVMYRGDMVEKNRTEDIFERPAHPYTQALLSAVPRLGSMAEEAFPRRFAEIEAQTGQRSEPPRAVDTVVAAQKPILEVSNLVTRFPIRAGLLSRVVGRVHAVENVSFSIHSGETLSLVGESGCGKSTTGRSIMRLVEPDSGSVRLSGEEILALPKGEVRSKRRSMQMIFQDPYSSLNPRMTVGNAIAEPMVVNGVSPVKARSRAAELLEQVGLQADMTSRYPHEFSGGQRQRICIARAIGVNPGVIVADEAVSALDVSVKAQVINLMLDLQERLQLAYLFISHDMAVVERVSHRVAVMYLGEIVEIGPRAAIFSNPQHSYTQTLLSAVPVVDPAQRHRHRSLANKEIKSPIRPLSHVAPRREYREVSPGHLVMVA